ncbi:MAG: holo-ACP synthase [candidate division KSB1 bacterium]|nr:holo-ACP synthase [candidate division KSB1 bacterium]MDZ7335343.1 holo-ACP synthase [candidate division KSB1 bacterium]MDZ7356816.1 holo-ACP synthase [candidate division KSB1 bacterium]MDZ7376714.1 holo-ACP synthase [candidate division KSB1 bacterium]MDZ7399029.1 holo-ACP synthase [candidate division KSB1 bacterium]
MIYGIGIDMIEVARFEPHLADRSRLLVNKIFTPIEIEYCEGKSRNQAQNYAVRYAAKEAFFKALGTGWRGGLSWQDVEVRRDELGKPYLVLYGKAKEIIEAKRITSVHVSLSHLKALAVAIVILEKGQMDESDGR